MSKRVETGHLAVGNGHEIYYELHGNPKGKLLVANNGGPGGSFKRRHLKIYNLKKHRVLFYDQRGCGQSTYSKLLAHNTTQDLVEDIHKLILYVGYDKAIIAGGSWGSTLALCFAIKYPQMVTELRLSGIFLGTKKEIDYCKQLSTYFPEFADLLISTYGENYLQTMRRRILLYDDSQAAQYLEVSECVLMSYTFDYKKALKQEFEILSAHKLMAHYMSQNCFLPSNYIMRNVKKIAHIKTSIVQGNYDLLCVPLVAKKLADKFDNCKLDLVIGGHYEDKNDTASKLLKTIKRQYAR